MDPIVNKSVKGLSQIKGAPASASRFTPKYYDREPPHPGAKALKEGFFKTQDDITTPLKQIGMNPQYMISLPCVEINDLANKKIHMGKGRGFNSTLVNPIPITGMDKIAFEPEMRIGTNGMDKFQSPFTFGSFQWAC